jgi:hypothetical protein
MKVTARLFILLSLLVLIIVLSVFPYNKETVSASTSNIQKQNQGLQKTVNELTAKLKAKEKENTSLKAKVKTLENKVKIQEAVIKKSKTEKLGLDKQLKNIQLLKLDLEKQVKNFQTEKVEVEKDFQTVRIEFENKVKSLTSELTKVKLELEKVKMEKPKEEPQPEPKPTEPSSKGFTYKGLVNISNETTKNLSTKVHSYVLSLPNAKPINVYVTDLYIKEYGEGFGYDEIEAMMESVQKVRGGKPYENWNNSLEFYFYVNNRTFSSDDENFPANVQAQAGSSGNGVSTATKILINGGGFWDMDFRPRILHEIAHYFDAQTINQKGLISLGNNAPFWYEEGGAEYAAYHYYQYPKNTKNNRKLPIIANTKETIIKYALEQTKNRPVVDSAQLTSFNDLRSASN